MYNLVRPHYYLHGTFFAPVSRRQQNTPLAKRTRINECKQKTGESTTSCVLGRAFRIVSFDFVFTSSVASPRVHSGLGQHA